MIRKIYDFWCDNWVSITVVVFIVSILMIPVLAYWDNRAQSKRHSEACRPVCHPHLLTATEPFTNYQVACHCLDEHAHQGYTLWVREPN